MRADLSAQWYYFVEIISPLLHDVAPSNKARFDEID
jgi:hypothetical protein